MLLKYIDNLEVRFPPIYLSLITAIETSLRMISLKIGYSKKTFIYISFVPCLLFSSCFPNKLEGVRGASASIAESQSREVFICKVSTDKLSYKFNDTLNLVIKEAFLEKGWGYGTKMDSTQPNYIGRNDQPLQIVLVVNEDCCDSSLLGLKWEISRRYLDSFMSKGNGLIVNQYHPDSLNNMMIYDVLLGEVSKINYPIDKRVGKISLELDTVCLQNLERN